MTNTMVKRKRNVFGQRISQRGVIVLLVFEIALIIAASLFFDKTQNDIITAENEQTAFYEELEDILKEDRSDLPVYANIGYLIPTLPTSFVQQECSQDINRLQTMSDVEGTNPDYTTEVESPIESDVETLNAVKITFNITTDDMTKLLTFINYLTNSDNERFFYISQIDITSIGLNDTVGTAEFIVYTFYNAVDIQEVIS